MKSEKKCTKCGMVKPLSDFGKDKQAKDGLKFRCKNCLSVDRKEYYRKNTEKCVERSRKWYWDNHDKALSYYHNNKEKRRAYIEENRERIAKYMRDYSVENAEALAKYREDHRDANRAGCKRRYWANREEHIKKVTEWVKANPEKVKANRYRRRSREVNAPGRFTSEEWVALCSKYDNKCVRCGKKTKLTVDHVVPLSRGGSNYIENIQPLCLSCNCKKRTRKTDYRARFEVDYQGVLF